MGNAVISYEEWRKIVKSEKNELKRLMGENYSEEQFRILNVPNLALQHLINREPAIAICKRPQFSGV